MSEPSPPATVVAALHGALLAGPVVVLGVVYLVFRDIGPLAALSGPAGYALYAACAAGLAGAVWWRTRIPARPAADPRAAYWRATFPRALVLWALTEGCTTAGGLVALLAGEATVALALVALHVALMLAFAPDRLEGA